MAMFLHRYIYDNNSNTYMFIYIKIVYTFLIKLSATTKQLIRSNSICCLKNLAIFFHRVNIEIGFSPPLPMFAFIQSLRHPPPLHNKPFIKKVSLEEMEGVNHSVSAFMNLHVKANK